MDVAISGSPSPPSPAREFHFRPFLSGGSFSILLRGGFFAFFGTVTTKYLRLSTGEWQTDKRSKSPHFLQLFAFLFFIYSMGCGPPSGNSAAVETTATSSSKRCWIEAYLYFKGVVARTRDQHRATQYCPGKTVVDDWKNELLTNF